ncbi:MAG: adenine deaminase C-terminal domain-containing protein [Bacillota bacterium]
MINTQPKDRRALLACAMGKIPADKCLSNVQLVNVLTGEIYPCDVYVFDGFIAHVEIENCGKDINAKEIIDCGGEYLIPGLIDAHIHIESSMLTPRHFAKGVVPHGTTTIITDPHEISNVFGEEAVHYMHDSSEDLPMRQLINIPSCVPAVPGLENSGAVFLVPEIERLAKLERVIGLAEVMDFIAVVNGEDRMMNIMDSARENGLYLQGHAPFISGRILSAYAIGGARTCHESRLPSEFREKLRIGMSVDARESSIAKNGKDSIEGIKGMKFLDNYCVCTDDREADDIIKDGHMNVVVNNLIEYGLDPITAIKSATYNNAREAKIENLGAIAPGYIADMILTKEITHIKPTKVFYKGELVAENGKLTAEIEEKSYPLESKNSMNIPDFDLETFKFKAPIQNGKVDVNVMTYPDHTLAMTTCEVESLNVVDGYIDISNDNNLKFIAILNRYGNGTIGYGIVRNFGTNFGAQASTISHDSHNLTIVYDNAENALIATKALVESGGGMAMAYDNKLQATITLNVGGLMSTAPIEEVARQGEIMKTHLEKAGLDDMHNPLLRIVTLALPVIPNVKMSDMGLVDVNNKKIVPFFA